MAVFRAVLLLSLASVILCGPVALQTNTTTKQQFDERSNFPQVTSAIIPVQPVVLMPLTPTSADQPAFARSGPMGRSDSDYNAEGRAGSYDDALQAMSGFLTPKFMQPGQASASMIPSAGGPQAPAAVQQSQQVPQQQSMQNFQNLQPYAAQYPQQQPMYLPQQAIPQQQAMDPRMLSIGNQMSGYGGAQGMYPMAQPAGFGQAGMYPQMRALNTPTQQAQVAPANFAGQQQPIQQTQQIPAGAFNGMPMQNNLPAFSGNNQNFAPATQQQQQFSNMG